MLKKNIFLLFLTILLPISIVAQNQIALESSGTVQLFNTLDDALGAAVEGDDLYLPGGIIITNSSSYNIGERINIYGVGYNSVANAITGPTEIKARLNFIDAAKGSVIAGVKMPGITLIGAEDMVIERCWFEDRMDLNTSARNIFIRESIIEGFAGDGTEENIFIEKSILGDPTTQVILGNVAQFNISHSLFFASEAGSQLLGSSMNNCSFEDCVFVDESCGAGQLNGSSANNQFSNCLFSCSPSDFLNQTLINCTFDQGVADLIESYSGQGYIETDDFQLVASSPGNNAATDGTDIGIFGTSNPFKVDGLPRQPHILLKNISSTTDQNGNLLINFVLEAQDQ